MILSIAIVALAVCIETWYGDVADNIADDMRTALTMMATGRRVYITPTFRALSAYKGIPAVVDPDGPPWDNETFLFSSALNSKISMIAGWNVIPPGVADPGLKNDKFLAAGENVLIETRSLPTTDPFSRGYAPTRFGERTSPKTPDEKAAAAAEALVSYLKSVGIAAMHGEMPSRLVPSGEVHIAIGPRESTVDPELLANLERTLEEMSKQ